ncbi:MAG: phosphonopyruvate decarboxylase [Ramlibacter sp.]|nr:phosphonopyruvate decarboxylase [Ramlibacter sp.]
MTHSAHFTQQARQAGFDFYCSVPCSYLTPLLNSILSDPAMKNVAAASEGEAMGIAAGAFLAGRMPVVLMQNSGLGNAVNPLTSLNHVFKIPALLICSWRGCPGHPDEPQHSLMGQITHRLLDTIGIRHAPFPAKDLMVEGALAAARNYIRSSNLPYALIVEPNAIEDEPLRAAPEVRAPSGKVRVLGSPGQPLPSREDVIRAIVKSVPNDSAFIATTGNTGRELFAIEDTERNLYLVGSMGCASAVGLGVALNVARPIVVLDGDGAALMKLGNLSTIGRYAPSNLIHVLLNNGVHDSTGRQPTNAGNVDFCGLARSSGYRSVHECHGLPALQDAVSALNGQVGPHFLHVNTRPGSMSSLPRPTISPPEVGLRFTKYLQAPVAIANATTSVAHI